MKTENLTHGFESAVREVFVIYCTFAKMISQPSQQRYFKFMQ